MLLKKHIAFLLSGIILYFTFFSHLSAMANIPQRNYIETIRNIDFYSNKINDTFLSTLAKEYKSYALFKANYTPDTNMANYFALKALNAYHGERVHPENAYKKQLSQKNIVEITNYYEDLINFLQSDLVFKYPQLVAEAQAKFDCWIDSETNGLNPKQSTTCRSRFIKAHKYLKEKLQDDCKCKKTKKQKTITEKKVKKYDGKIIPIPKWPNLPAIKNEPPIPVMKQTIIREVAQQQTQPVVQPVVIETKSEKAPVIVQAPDNTEIKNAIARIEQEIREINTKLSNQKNNDTKDIENKLKELKQSLENSSQPDLSILQQQLAELQNKLANSTCPPTQNATEIKTTPKPITNSIQETNEDEDDNEEEEEIIDDDEEDNDENENEDEEEEIIEEEPSPNFKTITEEEIVETEVNNPPSDLLPYELFFDWNDATVKSQYDSKLKDIAINAGKSKEMILITGHTDSSGTPEYNQKLSKRRADNVGKIIMSYGVPFEKIILKGVGSKDPKIKTKPGERNAENRRVVIN